MDGNQGTAVSLLAAINEQTIKDHLRQLGKDRISKYAEHSLLQINEQKLYNKVFMKYRIMTMRAKISFMALEKRQTITEFIVTQILNSYQELVNMGHIQVCKKKQKHDNAIIDSIAKGNNDVFVKIMATSNLLPEGASEKLKDKHNEKH